VGFWVEKNEQLDLKKSDILREEFQKFQERAIEMGFSSRQIRGLLDEMLPPEGGE
jgi:DNA-binding transcriptional regulator YhcF (GntR family)